MLPWCGNLDGWFPLDVCPSSTKLRYLLRLYSPTNKVLRKITFMSTKLDLRVNRADFRAKSFMNSVRLLHQTHCSIVFVDVWKLCGCRILLISGKLLNILLFFFPCHVAVKSLRYYQSVCRKDMSFLVDFLNKTLSSCHHVGNAWSDRQQGTARLQ